MIDRTSLAQRKPGPRRPGRYRGPGAQRRGSSGRRAGCAERQIRASTRRMSYCPLRGTLLRVGTLPMVHRPLESKQSAGAIAVVLTRPRIIPSRDRSCHEINTGGKRCRFRGGCSARLRQTRKQACSAYLAPGPENPVDMVRACAHVAASRKVIAYVQTDETDESRAKSLPGTMCEVSAERMDRLSRRYLSWNPATNDVANSNHEPLPGYPAAARRCMHEKRGELSRRLSAEAG